MALDDRLAELVRAQTPPGCSFGKFVADLPAATAGVLESLLSSRVSNESVRMALALEGHRFSRDTIGNHRHGRCLCAITKQEPAR